MFRPRWAGAAFPALVILAGIGCMERGRQAGAESADWQARRTRMVREQLGSRDITDERVLSAMESVPRHEFVPERLRNEAYGDYPLPIGAGQTISQPYVVALMTQLLGLTGDERVLEIGTGSGYQAAILARLCKEVYTIEIDPSLAEQSRTRLAGLGYENVHVRAGDGFFGWPEAAPFDAIIITAAAPRLPEGLVKQLRDGGKVVAPIRDDGWQELMFGVKRDEAVELRPQGGVMFVPMRGKVEDDPAGTPTP